MVLDWEAAYTTASTTAGTGRPMGYSLWEFQVFGA
jgi:hypothetical protein